MRAIKVILGLISASTLGVVAGLMGIIPFYPVSWGFSAAMGFFSIVQIIYFLMIDEAEMECALRKKEMIGFCSLSTIVALILYSMNTDLPAPDVTISLSKNVCLWMPLFEIYLFWRVLKVVYREDDPKPEQKPKTDKDKPDEKAKHVVKEAIKRKITRFTLSSAERELYSLIGLLSVKKEIVSLKNMILAQNKRVDAGLPSVPMSYHCTRILVFLKRDTWWNVTVRPWWPAMPDRRRLRPMKSSTVPWMVFCSLTKHIRSPVATARGRMRLAKRRLILS